MTSKRCQNEIKEWSNTMKDNLVFTVYPQTFFAGYMINKADETRLRSKVFSLDKTLVFTLLWQEVRF